ncbi:MAG: methyltransferase domain-containing protein [Acidimicrobiales bacterium]|nr:methyltransferase domain-containing protein [Acidimicrobiales bacterium]
MDQETTTAWGADWSGVADAWDEHADRIEALKAPVTETLLSSLALGPGDRVLELGAGPGRLAARLAEAVGPTGSVLVTDVAAGMVEAARRRVEGIPGVSTARIDVSAIDAPVGAFDAVVIRMGLMFAPDPAVALREIRRVLAPGGRAGIAVWAGIEHNPWLTSVGMALMANGLVTGGPPVGPGEVFSLGDPDRLAQLLTDAGLRDVQVEPVDIESRFATSEEHLAHAGSLAPPLAAALRSASPEQLDAVRQTASDLVKPHATAEGLLLPGRALVASGRA